MEMKVRTDSKTWTGSMEERYSTSKTFTIPTRRDEGSLTERFNEAYDEEAKREDEEFVKHVKKYHRRRFSDEW